MRGREERQQLVNVCRILAELGNKTLTRWTLVEVFFLTRDRGERLLVEPCAPHADIGAFSRCEVHWFASSLRYWVRNVCSARDSSTPTDPMATPSVDAISAYEYPEWRSSRHSRCR